MSSRLYPSSDSGMQPDGTLSIPVDRLRAAAIQLFTEARAGNPLLQGKDLYLLAVRQALRDQNFNWTNKGQRQAVKTVLYQLAYSNTYGNTNLID